jgi:predicted CXXCH cytochrome family protein
VSINCSEGFQRPMNGARRPPSSGLRCVCCLALLIFSSALDSAARTPASAGAVSDNGYIGDQACQQCHAAIYESFLKTAMAKASGPAAGNLIPGDFTDAASNVHYRVFEQSGRVWLSFDREGTYAMHDRRELLYFIGSGRRGRTYVFAKEGFFFESPINWYGQKRLWEMTPAYQGSKHMPLNLPLAASCLDCHTSHPQTPFPGTDDKYAEPLIAQDGIGCERCHGPGADHAKNHGAIINPSKLAPARRDAVCMQCHLEGDVAISQPGHALKEFRPGENLQDYVHYFVLSGAVGNLPAVSQFEALWQSMCKRKSGDSFSCTTCHDPHSSPNPAEKVAYYRQKCLACHHLAFARKHHKSNPDCVSCHMPAGPSSNIAHTQVTDHRILRYPGEAAPATAVEQPAGLERFPPADAKIDDRDLALAEESIVPHTATAAKQEELLRKALAENPNDPELLTAMGYLYQSLGKTELSRQFYERALQIDPLANAAATNLGVIEAQEGSPERAVQLWESAFYRAPGDTAIGLNLCKVLWQLGKQGRAREELGRVLEFNPDFPEAQDLLREWSGDTAPR